MAEKQPILGMVHVTMYIRVYEELAFGWKTKKLAG
jgi:hypothetical protein